MSSASPRHKSVAVRVGGVTVGGGAPIVVQSMTNTDTADIEGTARQVAALAAASGDRELAFDLAQETFARALERGQRVRVEEGGSAWPWLPKPNDWAFALPMKNCATNCSTVATRPHSFPVENL